MTTRKVRVAIHFIMSGNRAYTLIRFKTMFQLIYLIFCSHYDFVSSSGQGKTKSKIELIFRGLFYIHMYIRCFSLACPF